jgi:gluconolactonase
MTTAETVAAGLGLLEGPVWRDDTDDLLVTGVGSGFLLRVDLQTGTVTRFADAGGGPNGAYPCADGGVLVTQNGGLDWVAIGIDNPEPSRPTTPGIQRVTPEGTVQPLTTPGDGPFRAPNDLCATPDGTVWFTDPPQFPPPPEPVGRIWRWRPGGRPEVFAAGLAYCNGIGIDGSGAVLVVEQRGLMTVNEDGTRTWLVETLPSGGDGFAFDIEGNIYVAGGRHITVVSPDGTVADQLAAPAGRAMVTNCCFGGADLRTLYATDGGSGRILAFPGLPVPGVPLPPWPGWGGVPPVA